MQIVSDEASARRLAASSKAVFYSNLAGACDSKTGQYVFGRRYRGIFGDSDGSFVTVTNTRPNEFLIDRDCYGAIPLFYSTTLPIVSTSLGLLIRLLKPEFDLQALAEYLSAVYLTAGKT